MPLSTPSAEVRAALNDLRTAARTLGEGALTPPATLDSDAAARSWAGPLVAEVARIKASHNTSLTRMREQASAPLAIGADSWRRVDEAFNKLEAEFTSSSALKSRLAEGRRSMSSKAERVVQENLSASVQLTGNRAEASLDPEGVSTLQDALPRWILGWADYALRAYEVDLHRLVDRLWCTRGGELPVPRPTFSVLPPPPRPRAPDFPTVSQTIDLEGFGGVVKHARSVLYGVMSLGLLFGLQRSSGEEGVNPLMIGAALAAIAFGYVQYRAEQATRIERFEADVGKRAEQAVKSVLMTWYDRQNDKLLEHCTVQLHERRRQLVEWYRTEVAPVRARDAAAAAQRKLAAEAARRQVAELERQTRDLSRAEAAVRTLAGAPRQG